MDAGKFPRKERLGLPLLEALADWTVRLKLPRLGNYGITGQDFPRIVANSRGSSMKTNPVLLNDGEISAILLARL